MKKINNLKKFKHMSQNLSEKWGVMEWRNTGQFLNKITILVRL